MLTRRTCGHIIENIVAFYLSYFALESDLLSSRSRPHPHHPVARRPRRLGPLGDPPRRARLFPPSGEGRSRHGGLVLSRQVRQDVLLEGLLGESHPPRRRRREDRRRDRRDGERARDLAREARRAPRREARRAAEPRVPAERRRRGGGPRVREGPRVRDRDRHRRVRPALVRLRLAGRGGADEAVREARRRVPRRAVPERGHDGGSRRGHRGRVQPRGAGERPRAGAAPEGDVSAVGARRGGAGRRASCSTAPARE